MMNRNSFVALANLGEGDEFQIEEFTWDIKPTIDVGTIENFQGQPKLAAKKSSFMGKKCIDFIKSNPIFQEKYRIELVPDKEERWKLHLHLDPMAWFDALISRQNETRSSMIKKVREFVDSTRKTSHPQKFFYKPVLSRTYCAHHGECVRSKYLINIMQTLNAAVETNRNSITDSKNCSWFAQPPNIYCQADSPQQNRLSRPCN